MAGQAAVERAVLDVARHLLGADQRTVDFRVVDGRVVAAAGVGDLVAGFGEQACRRFLQAARRDAEFEDRLTHFLYTCLGSKTRSPITWQSVALDAAEEAAGVALVAGGAADLVDLEQDGVGVAIDEDLAHFLDVAALLALAPEAVAAAAEVDGPARAQRLLVGFAVHPGQHEDGAAVGVLGDGRHQAAAFVEIDHGPFSPYSVRSGEGVLDFRLVEHH